MLTINAAHKDCIERILHCEEYKREIPFIVKVDEYDLEDTDKDVIKTLINSYEDCYFLDNVFYVRRSLTEVEQETKQHNNTKVIKYSTNQLNKWISLSESNKSSILTYLNIKGIKIQGIN